MTKAKAKEKGNGGDKDAAEQVKKQMEFLGEVKELAKKYGIPMGATQLAGKSAQAAQRQLQIQVRRSQDQIVVDFGQQISWMGLKVEQATKFAASIIKQVQAIQGVEASGGTGAAPAPDEEEKEPVDKAK